jgi:hypothetical protein
LDLKRNEGKHNALLLCGKRAFFLGQENEPSLLREHPQRVLNVL